MAEAGEKRKMFDQQHYMPVMKWRMGEYQALMRLSDDIKDRVTPLFELPTEAWDFENEQPAKSLDEHFEKFGSRLRQKWDGRRCLIDSPYYDGATCMASGIHHLEHVFNLVRANEGNAIPVVGLDREADYVSAVKSIAKTDGKGVGVRLAVDDFQPNLPLKLHSLLAEVDVSNNDCDLMVDCAEDVAFSSTAQGLVWKALLDQVPDRNAWRSLTVASAAFPAALPAGTFRPHGTAPRHDWLGYKALVSSLPEGYRIPSFGDYVVAHPNTELMDPRMFDPNAKIKYTIDDAWFVAMGVQVKKHGRGQYASVCRTIVEAKPPVFDGADYSHGDDYIDKCANHGGSTGGPSTWPTVASNRHITKVVRDVASLFGA
jgi:hypothetical protein